MTIDRAIEILDPEHREHYKSIDPSTVKTGRSFWNGWEKRRGKMSNELTYMDCWNFIAPLIPVSNDYTMDIYVMVFNALKEAEKKRIAEKKKGRKS